MWPCGDDCSDDAQPQIGAAFGVYLGINLALVFCAAVLTYYAPLAAASGLPQIKAFLNGVKLPGLLRASTLFAKVRPRRTPRDAARCTATPAAARRRSLA